MTDITIYSGENLPPAKVFDSLYELTEISFPACERRTKAEHFAEYEHTQFRSLCYCPNGNLAGYMNYWEMDEFIYLEHFAVSPELRGKGIGAAMAEELKKLSCGLIVLEAEPSEQSDTAKRRTGFYERLGFTVNPYDYIQPPISGNQPPVLLRLMTYPRAISQSEYLNIRRALYSHVYGVGGDWKCSLDE